MKRAEVFVLLILASLVSLGGAFALYLFSGSPHGGFYGWMMGQMYGWGMGGEAAGSPGGTWIVFAALLAVGAVGVGGLAYSLAYPEIKETPAPPAPSPAPSSAGEEMSWDVLVRTSKEDERKVLEALAAHGGSYLQKFVVKEAGLSKLKTHRIVARLAERGVVTVERSGNTNQVSLARWVRGAPAPRVADGETKVVSSAA